MRDSGLAGVDRRVIPQLEALHLSPDAHLHFGRDAVLPRQDTLDFSSPRAWERNLAGAVWDPASLSGFWFELLNGAYGDVYHAKALVNLPDGRAFFRNWMVSREGSQLLPLQLDRARLRPAAWQLRRRDSRTSRSPPGIWSPARPAVAGAQLGALTQIQDLT
ncbi:MAG: hypothetical protein ACK41W_03780 [Cyanobacteriota bacterium]|jgi:hypothetical protein